MDRGRLSAISKAIDWVGSGGVTDTSHDGYASNDHHRKWWQNKRRIERESLFIINLSSYHWTQMIHGWYMMVDGGDNGSQTRWLSEKKKSC